jgi:hypothetical protein
MYQVGDVIPQIPKEAVNCFLPDGGILLDPPSEWVKKNIEHPEAFYLCPDGVLSETIYDRESNCHRCRERARAMFLRRLWPCITE